MVALAVAAKAAEAVSVSAAKAAARESSFFIEKILSVQPGKKGRWAAAQTCLRDFIPQTPFFASLRFEYVFS